MKKETGKAYALFDCTASKAEIEQALPLIRECAQTPSVLEISLKDSAEGGTRYALKARVLPSTTNRQTADEIAAVLNQAYQSPLYKPEQKEPFRGVILYEEDGRYISRN